MTTLSAEPMTDLIEAKKHTIPTRQQLPPRYAVGVDFVIDQAGSADQQLERAIAIVKTGLQDGTIQPAIGAKLLISLVDAFTDVTRIHQVMKFLRESGLEVHQREVERINALHFNVEKLANGVKKP